MAKEVLLSEGPGVDHVGGGGGGGFEAPPPPGGLGNFKGVMLCNRPSEVPIQRGDLDGGGGDGRPFRSTVSATYKEQVGLNPPPRKEQMSEAPPVNEVLKRHGAWLRSLKEKISEEKANVATTAEVEEEKRKGLAEFCQRQRDCVKAVMAEIEPGDQPDRKVLADALKGKKKQKKGKQKPLWAMTGEQQEQFNEEQAADLIDFAENLDFDQFVHDMEFREALAIAKDRAGVLEKEQSDFKAQLVEEFNKLAEGDEEEDLGTEDGRSFEDGIDGTSLQDTSEGGAAPRPRRRAKASKEAKETADGRPEWDASTTADDERDRPDERTREAAERALEDRQMKQIHSKESIQKIIQKQKEKEREQETLKEMQQAANLVALVENLQAEKQPPNPVISVSEDTLGRANKPIDPSMLPYLYRSPAV